MCRPRPRPSVRARSGAGVSFADAAARSVGRVDPWSAVAPRERPDGVWFSGPDGNLLLSDEFLGDHCFAVDTTRMGAGDLGLTFEPAQQRKLPDIKGILWMDRRSGALRAIEFEYQNVAIPEGARPAHGSAHYGSLGASRWAVAEWVIDVPRTRRLTMIAPRDAAITETVRNTRDSLIGYRQIGGYTSKPVGATTGSFVARGAPAVVRGQVRDSVTGMPVAGVDVSLDGRPAVQTDARGNVRLEIGAVGAHEVEFSMPRLNPVLDAIRFTIDVGELGATQVLDVAWPTFLDLATRLCSRSTSFRAGNVGIAGRVDWGRTAAPADSVVAAVAWSDESPDGTSPAGTHLMAVPVRRNGGFLACWLPAGRQVRIEIREGRKLRAVQALQLPITAFAELVIRVP